MGKNCGTNERKAQQKASCREGAERNCKKDRMKTKTKKKARTGAGG
jgi:hypothetical protein